MSQAETLFLMGLIVGFMAALTGAFLDYRISLRRVDTENPRLPGCLLLEIGALGLIGVFTTVMSFLLRGGVMPPLITGAGVVSGFFAGFVLLVVGWLMLERVRGN